MFNSMQDYMDRIITKEQLLNDIITSEEYAEATPEIRNRLDLYIEDLKDAKSFEDERVLLGFDYITSLGVELTPIKLFDLASRVGGGTIPILDIAELTAFIDSCIIKKDDERLLRLAYNYNKAIPDKSVIEDYYINDNNVPYLIELACNDLIGLHYDKITDFLAKSNELEELKAFASNFTVPNVDISKVLDRIKEIEKN